MLVAVLLKGKPVADAILAQATADTAALSLKGVVPTLALLRVGEDPGDISYERSLRARADQAGVAVQSWVFPIEVSQGQLEEHLEAINKDPSVHGCLLFRPLPASFDEEHLCQKLAPEKDVDGITRASLAAVFCGDASAFAPSTAEACLLLLKHYQVPLDGAQVVVVGRSLVVGRPLSQLLLQENATVTLCHSRTRHLEKLCRAADILVLAAGRARAFGEEYFHAGQTVVDVGINFDETGKICGDADEEAAARLCAAYTPVPGGVGSITAAVSVAHTVHAAMRAR